MRLLAVVTFALFLVGPVRAGWTQAATDFPNYYTAARLVTQGQPLRRFYDWTWFARQLNVAGFENRVGSYTPQAPLTMLPLVAVANLAPQRAKQAWIAANVLFVVLIVWLLSRMTRFRAEQAWLLLFVGYFALYTNFLYGQYYTFLLLLLTYTCYLLHRDKRAAAGFMAGLTFGLKLYGAPFLLYFAVRRDWRAVGGMLVAMALAGAVTLGLFGAADTLYYLTQVLPRSLEGGSVDPYSAGNPTVGTMLRSFFMREPGLNPTPLMHAPWLFFFLRTFLTGAIVVFTALGLRGRGASYDRRALGWFLISVLLLATSLSSYSFLLLGLPVVLMLDETRPAESALLIGSFALLAYPIGAVAWFPKVWLLLLLFAVLGREYWRPLPVRRVILAAAAVAAIALVDATRRLADYSQEPGQRFERVAVEPGVVFASSPAVSRAGLFYQVMGPGRYELHWLHGDRIDTLAFDGQAFHPVAGSPNGPIYFELAAHGRSTMMQFDAFTRRTTVAPIPLSTEEPDSVTSPDGQWVASVSRGNGPARIRLRHVATGKAIQLTGGRCNSDSPAWELDSRYVVFASDCGRALGLPVLYRAPIPP